jgi:hypothetical protein
MEQVTALALAFGQDITPGRLRLYAHDLSDLGAESLSRAFTRARLELKYFPQIAELRDLASAPRPEERDEVEAQAAFRP